MTSTAVVVAMAGVLSALMLGVYDRTVVRPTQRLAVVDLAMVMQAKEAEFAELMTRSGTPAERERAQALATEFSRRLPAALEQLPAECECVVISKSALLATPREVRDLTPRLQELLQGGPR
ncbi:MAG TPA: hypothetical protein PK177_10175 [Burkholderiaceae bacterium]|nr:hypothetical protein [Burkholderiaceae bacterium]